jgi:hypothetical protein
MSKNWLKEIDKKNKAKLIVCLYVGRYGLMVIIICLTRLDISICRYMVFPPPGRLARSYTFWMISSARLTSGILVDYKMLKWYMLDLFQWLIHVLNLCYP